MLQCFCCCHASCWVVGEQPVEQVEPSFRQLREGAAEEVEGLVGPADGGGVGQVTQALGVTGIDRDEVNKVGESRAVRVQD